jgi:ABC-2 type transport system permease protein
MTVVAEGSGALEAIQRPRSDFQRNVNLIRELSITSFKLKYTGSALGYVWSLAKPLMYFGIMYLVFSILLKAGAGSFDFPVQLLVAIVAWTFFT